MSDIMSLVFCAIRSAWELLRLHSSFQPGSVLILSSSSREELLTSNIFSLARCSELRGVEEQNFAPLGVGEEYTAPVSSCSRVGVWQDSCVGVELCAAVGVQMDLCPSSCSKSAIC